jgi:hypothetical protein
MRHLLASPPRRHRHAVGDGRRHNRVAATEQPVSRGNGRRGRSYQAAGRSRGYRRRRQSRAGIYENYEPPDIPLPEDAEDTETDHRDADDQREPT